MIILYDIRILKYYTQDTCFAATLAIYIVGLAYAVAAIGY